MHRARWVIGVLGIVVAASAASADIPKEVTLFGQRHSVHVQSRGGTFKNGVKITPQTPGADVDTRQKANLAFVEGADRSADRLFVVAPIGSDTDGPTGDQFYLLTGSDEKGIFSPTVSNATQFFGGNVERLIAGRPQNVTWLSDTDTGKKKDRNIALWTFTGDDRIHFYDLDTLTGGTFEENAVHVLNPGDDENQPTGSWQALARTPNGFLISVADSGGVWEMNVMDPTQDWFFNAKTDLVEVTTSGGKAIEHSETRVHALARYDEDEYWILSSAGDPGGDNDEAGGEQYITWVRITLPADLGKAEPGSIKAELVGQEEIFSKNLHASPGGLFGMAIGREVLPGKRVVYLADWAGNLITLTPIQ
jgi:hypothetical protein